MAGGAGPTRSGQSRIIARGHVGPVGRGARAKPPSALTRSREKRRTKKTKHGLLPRSPPWQTGASAAALGKAQGWAGRVPTSRDHVRATHVSGTTAGFNARFRGAVLRQDSETIGGTAWIPGEENHLRPAPRTLSPHRRQEKARPHAGWARTAAGDSDRSNWAARLQATEQDAGVARGARCHHPGPAEARSPQA